MWHMQALHESVVKLYPVQIEKYPEEEYHNLYIVKQKGVGYNCIQCKNKDI